MSINGPEMSFEVVYQDDHLLQVEVKASNGRYSGVTTFYCNSDGAELVDFARKLQGFPLETGQEIMQEFGSTQSELYEKNSGSETILSYIGLSFFCIDKQGHMAVVIHLLEDHWSERQKARGNVSFELRFDPASLDSFAQEIIALGNNGNGNATLVGYYDDKELNF